MANPFKSVIVGTAGHIDHGKSALVEALTGTHPDRLEEEKRRGITIDLGFAFLEEAGVRFGFVDVPGHERFVRNMLAGAAGIDIVVLVIAADESIKPQTREHFDICQLLGVQHGLVALTKCDLVDADTAALVRLEIEDYVRGTFLEGAPILPVSAKTRAGLMELKNALVTTASRVPGKDASRHFRLPIDRAFAMKGFGAVVTGTLISGSVRGGDEVELFPGGQPVRVRGVQSGGRSVEQAFAGQRTALNLAGIEHTALRRGMTLTVPGRFRSTERMDARLELLASAPKLKHRSRVHFHSGTTETIAEIFLYGGNRLEPGQDVLAHLHLEDEVLVLPGDRFIVRQFSPVITIGGGVVLDALARRPLARDKGRAAFLEVLEQGDPVHILGAMVKRAPLGLAIEEIRARTGWPDPQIRETTLSLTKSGRASGVCVDPLLLIPRDVFEAVRAKLAAKVAEFHKRNPLLPGIPREELRSSLGRALGAETFRAVLEELVKERALELQGDLVKRAGTTVRLDPEEERAKEQIEAAFRGAQLAVPTVRDVLSKVPVETLRAERILQMLLREKSLVRVTPELIFHHEALRELRERLGTYKRTKGERISVSVFKELTGITRKYAIPLLEYLDRERVTRRAGDERVIL